MKTLVNKITAFIADEQGAETVEWVLVAAALAVVIGATFGSTGGLRGVVSGAITRLGTAMGG